VVSAAPAGRPSGGFGVGVRLPILALGFLSLVLGVSGGLARFGGHALLPSVAAAWHGPLMMCGFFGTVIALERAVALGDRWAYVAPLAAGLAGVALWVVETPASAQILFIAASALLTLESALIFARNRALFTLTLALGAACWAVGNVAWAAGAGLPEVVPWWLAFLVLTIAGERLELTRLVPPSPGRQSLFAAIVVVIVAACAAALAVPTPGWRMLGAGLLALAAWLAVQDIARRTAREPGLTGYIGQCLLAGYLWLGIGALLLLGRGAQYASFAWDAALHAIALGFVFSMVFGHAPVIVPAIARVQVPFHWSFYVPFAALHLSVAIRVAGDLAADPPLRATGGVLSAVAIVAFVATVLAAVVRGRRLTHIT
jgi:hypothetical protein